MERINNYDQWKDLRKQIKETNDCTVVTMAQVLGIHYIEARKILAEKFGRKKGKGLPYEKCAKFDETMKAEGYTVVKGPYSEGNRISLNQFCIKHPKGAYYVRVRGHAIAVVDGVVYDHTHKPKRMVIQAFRVYREGELNK